MASPTKELRSLLLEYLAGSLKAGEFSECFAVVSSAAHRANDVAGQELCHAVGWAFLDRQRGDSSSAQLLQCLADLAAEPNSAVLVSPAILLGAVSYEVCNNSSGTPSMLQMPKTGVLMGRPEVSAHPRTLCNPPPPPGDIESWFW